MKVLIVDGLQALQEYLLLSKNVRVKFVTCGRKNCKCKLGERHGPYYYLRKKIGNKYKDIYIKTSLKSPSLKYEAVGGSVILDIRSVKEVPECLDDYPIFIVQQRVLNKSRD